MTSVTAPPGRFGPRHHIVSMDILRACAAALVVFYHFFYFSAHDAGPDGIAAIIGEPLAFPTAEPFTWWGWVGVYIFFVISGFVITMSAQNKTALDFAVGRFLRLYPALAFFATLALIVTWLRAPIPAGEAVSRWIHALTLYPQGPWIDGAIWTLTVEVMFYALIWLCVLGRRTENLPRYLRLVTAGLGLFWLGVFLQSLVGLGSAGAALLSVAAAYKSKFFLLTTGSFFALGMFLYESYRLGWRRERAIFALIATASCLMALHTFSLATTGPVLALEHSPWVPMLVWLLFTALCAGAVQVEARWQPGPRYRALARSVGLMTYPLYLINQVTGAYLIYLLLQLGLGALSATLIATLAIFAASYGFALNVEPALRHVLGRGVTALTGRVKRRWHALRRA